MLIEDNTALSMYAMLMTLATETGNVSKQMMVGSRVNAFLDITAKTTAKFRTVNETLSLEAQHLVVNMVHA